jgi:hypothetical protein
MAEQISDVAAPSIVQTTPSVRRAVRRLRWFRTSFRDQLHELEAATGNRYVLDEQQLARCFAQWLQAFNGQKDLADHARYRFTHYAAGLMLRALVKEDPVSARSVPEDGDPNNPAYFWPEGYAYVSYCLNLSAAVVYQDFGERMRLDSSLQDIRTWGSFRENVRRDPAMAIPFLEKFAGLEPNWESPSLFRAAGRADAGQTSALGWTRRPRLDGGAGEGD